MRKCKNLRNLPASILRLKSLQELHLDGCSNLEAFSEIMVDMKILEDLGLAKMTAKEFPSSIQHLKVLQVSGCSKLKKFHYLKGLFSLVTLHLSNQNLMDGAIPSDLRCLSSLEYLNLSQNNIRHIPLAITQLCKLKGLNISHCNMLQEIPKLPSSLKRIDAHDCNGLETLSSPSSLLWSSLLQRFQSINLRDLACHPNERGMGIKIPGGIPGWVMHQEIGNEVRLELPMNWYQDIHFLGFSCFCLYQPGKILHLNCKLKLGGDSYEDVDCVRFITWCGDCRINGSASDEIWVLYCPKIDIQDRYHSNQFRHFHASFATLRYGEKVLGDIKSCGVHLIYSKDHQQNHTPLMDFLGTQDNEHNPMPVFLDLLENFGHNESAAQDTNDIVKRTIEGTEQNQAEEPHHKRLRAPNTNLKL